MFINGQVILFHNTLEAIQPFNGIPSFFWTGHKAEAGKSVNFNKMTYYAFHTGRVIHKEIVGTINIFTNTDDGTLAAFQGIFEYPFPGLQILYRIQKQDHAVKRLIGRKFIHMAVSLKVFNIIAITSIGSKDRYIVARFFCSLNDPLAQTPWKFVENGLNQYTDCLSLV